MATAVKMASPAKNYVFVKDLGQGSFGKVLLYSNSADRRRYAVKQMNITDAETMKAAMTEFSHISSLRNPYIVAYKETWMSMSSLCIAMEYCEGGDLAQVIVKQAAVGTLLPEPQVRQWTEELCLGLQYMHGKNVIHRDLKPQNIFLTADSHVKIGDFGISRLIQPGELATTCIGTPLYLSPEIFSGSPYGNKTDVWSLGCCIYELMTLHPAIDANQLVLRRQMILQPMPTGGYSSQLIRATKLMLTQDPNRRPTVDEVMQIIGVTAYEALRADPSLRRRSTPAVTPPRSSGRLSDNSFQFSERMLPASSQAAAEVNRVGKPKIRIMCTVNQPGQQVRGLAFVGGELCIAQKFSATIVFYDRDLASIKRQLNVDGLKNPCDMAACPVNQCLYITEYKTRTVFKVDKDGNVLLKWSTDGQPDGVSVTPDSNIIVALRDANKLSEYDSDGTLLTHIYLGSEMGQPRHAIRLRNGQIVLCHGFDTGGLCLLSVSGKFVSRCDDSRAKYMPTHMAVGGRDQVYVADFSGSTVDLHDAGLHLVGEVFGANSGMASPFRICLDESGGRLYVSMFTTNCHLVVFRISGG